MDPLPIAILSSFLYCCRNVLNSSGLGLIPSCSHSSWCWDVQHYHRQNVQCPYQQPLYWGCFH